MVPILAWKRDPFALQRAARRAFDRLSPAKVSCLSERDGWEAWIGLGVARAAGTAPSIRQVQCTGWNPIAGWCNRRIPFASFRNESTRK